MYELYTLPNCHKCHDIKEELDKIGLAYEEVSLGQREGKKRLGKFYMTIESRLVRDEKNQVIPPIFVKRESLEDKEPKEFGQTWDVIQQIINGN